MACQGLAVGALGAAGAVVFAAAFGLPARVAVVGRGAGAGAYELGEGFGLEAVGAPFRRPHTRIVHP